MYTTAKDVAEKAMKKCLNLSKVYEDSRVKRIELVLILDILCVEITVALEFK